MHLYRTSDLESLRPRASIRHNHCTLALPGVEDIERLATLLAETPLLTDEANPLGDWAAEPCPTTRYFNSLTRGLNPEKWKLSKHSWDLDWYIFDGGTIVGCQGIHRENEFSFSTGSWLFPQYRGKGYGSVSRNLVYKFGFEYLDMQFGLSNVDIGNDASARINERQGSSQTSLQPRTVLTRGGEQMTVYSAGWSVSAEQFVDRTPDAVFAVESLLDHIHPSYGRN